MIAYGRPDESPVPFSPLTLPELNDRWKAALMAVGVHAVSGARPSDRDIDDYRRYLAAAVLRSAWVAPLEVAA